MIQTGIRYDILIPDSKIPKTYAMYGGLFGDIMRLLKYQKKMLNNWTMLK